MTLHGSRRARNRSAGGWKRLFFGRVSGCRPVWIPGSPTVEPLNRDDALAALRRRWAELIRGVYEVDPLLCPRCRGLNAARKPSR